MRAEYKLTQLRRDVFSSVEATHVTGLFTGPAYPVRGEYEFYTSRNDGEKSTRWRFE